MKKIIRISILLLILNILLLSQKFSSSTMPEVDHLQSTNSVSQLISHAPIVIDGNDDFALQTAIEGWNGNGSKLNPYIIENLSLQRDQNGPGLTIKNVDTYFWIKNCSFYGVNLYEYGWGDSGLIFENVKYCLITNSSFMCQIKLQNTSEIEIRDNYFHSTYTGMGGSYTLNVYSSYNNQILNNFFNHTGGGVSLSNTINTLIHNNSFKINIEFYQHGIGLSNSSFNIISNNSIREATHGIFIGDSSANNSIVYNSIKDCGWAGMGAGDGIAISDSSNNLIDSNIIKHGIKTGILIRNSPNNDIRNNRLEDDEIDITGDTKENCYQKYVINNSVNDKPIVYWEKETEKTVPTGSGQIILIDCYNITIFNQSLRSIISIFCQNVNIRNNTFTNSATYFGPIILEKSTHINISQNIITLSGLSGFYLSHCSHVHIQENQINKGFHGIYLDSCSDIFMLGNTIYQNSFRGVTFSFSVNCTLKRNVFIENGLGIDINTASADILVTYNVFISNNQDTEHTNSFSQVVDEGLRNSFILNYWSDWNKHDNNNDGIVDDPYPIYTGSGPDEWNHDLYPLVSTPDWFNLSSDFHILTPPQILAPRSHEVLWGTVDIMWKPSIDTKNHTIVYDLYFSPDLGTTWITMAENLESTFFFWNVTSLNPGSNYLIRIIAKCSEGLSSSVISIEPYYIFQSDPYTTGTSSAPSQVRPTQGFTYSFIIICLSIVIISKKKIREK